MKNVNLALNFPKIFFLGSLFDTPSSHKSLSREFTFKAPAAGCLSHSCKDFLCHFVLKDVALTSDSGKNNPGSVLLSLNASLMPGWSNSRLFAPCEMSDFTELHWQTGPELSTEKENALEQCEYMSNEQEWENVHHWTKHCKGGMNPGKSWINFSAECEQSKTALPSWSPYPHTLSFQIRNCTTQQVKYLFLHSQTGKYLEELPWEPNNFFFWSSKWKNINNVPEVISVPFPSFCFIRECGQWDRV